MGSKGYLAAIPDTALSRSHHAGHATLFRHVSAIVNGLLIDNPCVVRELLERDYNGRLRQLSRQYPSDGYDPWSPEELDHKITDAINDGPPGGKERGWLLKENGTESTPPMAWNNPALLARGIANQHTIRFIKDTAFIYDETRYKIIGDEALRALLQTHAEREANTFFDAQLRSWETEHASTIATLRRTIETASSITPPSPGVNNATIEREIRQRMQLRPRVVPAVSQRLINDTLGSLSAIGRLPDDMAFDINLTDRRSRNWLTVGNGILDLDAGRLLPHDSNWFSLVALPVAYDPNAQTPTNWLKFLNEVMEGDTKRVDLLQEVFGWCLDLQSRVQAVVFITGAGANGKTVFFHVLRLLLGQVNCSAVDLSQMSSGNHKFAAYGMLGKLANIKGDQAFVNSKDESALKELSGGDPFQFEAKGKQPICAVNHCKPLFGCNQLPTFSDKSEGIWRRLVPIPFPSTVPADQRNPALLSSNYWASELPGILSWALDGLARLRSRGRFDLPDSCSALSDRHRSDSNPARAFLLENYIVIDRDQDCVPAGDLYLAYRDWCNKSGYDHPLAKEPFGKVVKSTFPNAISESRRVYGPTTRVWVGIRHIDAQGSNRLFPT